MDPIGRRFARGPAPIFLLLVALSSVSIVVSFDECGSASCISEGLASALRLSGVLLALASTGAAALAFASRRSASEGLGRAAMSVAIVAGLLYVPWFVVFFFAWAARSS